MPTANYQVSAICIMRRDTFSLMQCAVQEAFRLLFLREKTLLYYLELYV